jgi:uncharacterized membrane protein
MKRWSSLEIIALGAFLFWVVCGLIFTAGRIGQADTAAWPLPPWLHSFVALCIATGDPLLIVLAFANSHLLAAREWGAGTARRWALAIVIISLFVETCGALTGFPFGAYHYTDRFGPVLGVVPLTIPLAWHVVLTNALFFVRFAVPYLPRSAEAAVVGVIAMLYDAVLEPFATRVKGYWQWVGTGAVPLQNYVAWFLIASVLVALFAPTSAGRLRRDPRPAIILGATLFLFLAGSFLG